MIEGLHALMQQLAARVDAWRGWPLGGAGEAWSFPGRYQPVTEGEQALSETSLILLQHWFRPDPHDVWMGGRVERFRYWPHQRRFVETVIYAHEVLGARSVDALYAAVGVHLGAPGVDPWPKLGGQLATGSGKTKMMSLVIAWATLNALREGASHLGIGPQTVVVAPGLFVRDRLQLDLGPTDRPSIFRADPVLPPVLERDWRLSVYGPDNTPLRLDPHEPALVITNIHPLQRQEEAPSEWPARGRQEKLIFGTPAPRRLEDESTPLMSRFRRGAGLLVINDEAHHVGDEPQHQKYEHTAKTRREARLEAQTEMAWIRSLRALHGRAGLGLQVDLSATLYEEEGGARKARGPQRPYRHTVVDYPLRNAIADGVVKQPVLERVVVTEGGEAASPVRENQPDAWLRYEPLLRAGIGRWTKVRDQFRAEGDGRKPILFILCADRREAQEVANFLTYGEASSEDLSQLRSAVGFVDPASGERLFVEDDGQGGQRSTVIQIHVGAAQNHNEKEWEQVRARIHAVDLDEVNNPRAGEPGQPATLLNPYNVVVSVMMLKEGWDVRNVKVIVPLRSCDSRTLTEQALGRGLRRMHPPEIAEDGATQAPREELYVMQHPSFDRIIDEIKDVVEVRDPSDIGHAPEYVRIEPRREPGVAGDVRLVRFLGERQEVEDWTLGFRAEPLPAERRLPWLEDFHDRDVETWLVSAGAEVSGQQFQLSAAPPFHEYDRLLEVAYVEPLLRDLQVAWSHKNAIKRVVVEFHRKSTFRLGRGQLLDFNAMVAEGGEVARMAVCNLLRPEVIREVKDSLRGPLRDAIGGRRSGVRVELEERRAAELGGYAARKQHELLRVERSVYTHAAFDSQDELRFARLLERCPDVEGWLYNHRQGVGWYVDYDWQGQSARYFPDFIVRVRWEGAAHNLVVEIKGRMDERDAAKVRAGQRQVAVLTQHHPEPWHFLLVHEDAKVGRADLSWMEEQAHPNAGALLRHIEGLADSTPLAARWLSRDGLRRRVAHLVREHSELSYAGLMELAERGEADRDGLLIAAEGLTTAERPGLRRLFVRDGRVLADAEVGRLMSSAAAGDDAGLRDVEVIYRPVGG